MNHAPAGSLWTQLAGYDVNHSGRLVERGTAACDAREGALKIIYDNAGAVELLSAPLFICSVERAVRWQPCRSAESTSAASGSWRISRMFSWAAAWRLARLLTVRALHGGANGWAGRGPHNQLRHPRGRQLPGAGRYIAFRPLRGGSFPPPSPRRRSPSPGTRARISPGGTPDVPTPGSETELRRCTTRPSQERIAVIRCLCATTTEFENQVWILKRVRAYVRRPWAARPRRRT